MTTPIFAYFNSNFKYIIKTYSSNYILGGVLSQYNNNSKLYLIAFFFKKKNLPFAKLNYEIYNKKLLIIIKYFK